VTAVHCTELTDDPYLERLGKQRPATMMTLVGTVSAIFEPTLDEAEARTLAEQLRTNGVLEATGSK
jgi:hypothetical protein